MSIISRCKHCGREGRIDCIASSGDYYAQCQGCYAKTNAYPTRTEAIAMWEYWVSSGNATAMGNALRQNAELPEPDTCYNKEPDMQEIEPLCVCKSPAMHTADCEWQAWNRKRKRKKR